MILYESDAATVYHADAAEVLPTIATESVDLVVTDPPYGVEYRSNLRAARFDGLELDGADDRDAIRDLLAECVRVVGQHRHLYVFGPTDVLDGLKIAAPVSLVWDKGAMTAGDLSLPWGRAHEPIAFAVSKYRHGGESGRASLAARIRKGSVLTHPRRTGRTVRHPTEKPLGLLRELVESSSSSGELVLDPFAGSGATGVAAILSGRRTILVEVDQAFAELTVARVRAAEAAHAEAMAL